MVTPPRDGATVGGIQLHDPTPATITKGTGMSVTQIPNEQGRFYVASRSRPEIWHVVDLAYVEDGRRKPRPFCGCEESMAKGHICAHILATVAHELERIRQ